MWKSVLIQYSDVFIEPDGSLGRTEQKIDKMLREDVIEPSNSPWAAPIVLVKKRDGTTRFFVDYRKLNSVTKDAYPLPRTDQSLDTLSEAKYFVL